MDADELDELELGEAELDEELGDEELGDVELGLAVELVLDVAPELGLAFFNTNPLPALLPVARCTQPVTVMGEPYVELVA